MRIENPEVLYVGSTRELVAKNVKNTETGELISDATVKIESIEDVDENEFSGLTYPIEMTPVTGTEGAYKAVLPHDAGFEVDKTYSAKVFVDAGANLKSTFWQALEAKRNYV